MEEKKGRSIKSKIITVLLGICLFCVFVIFGWKLFIVKDETPNKENNAVKRQKGVLECHKDSEISLNGYNVKIDIVEEENLDCLIGRIYINGVDKTNKLLLDLDGINDYEVFGNYLIYNAGGTDSVFLGIYDMKNDVVKKYYPIDMEYFKVRSWESDDNGITIDCINVKDDYYTKSNHNTEFAQFRMEYKDNRFSDPKFLKEYGVPVGDGEVGPYFITPGIIDIVRNTNKEYKLNNNKVTIRNDEKGFFINDKEYTNYDLTSSLLIVTNKYIIFYNYGQCKMDFRSYIDEDGNVKELKIPDYMQFDEIKYENGELTAKATYCVCDNDECKNDHNVKFVYENKELSMVDVN